jgi:hypothetical protein
MLVSMKDTKERWGEGAEATTKADPFAVLRDDNEKTNNDKNNSKKQPQVLRLRSG